MDRYYSQQVIRPSVRQAFEQVLKGAICVQNFSVRRVLQFTPLNAASCVLHRSVNRVIHRLKLLVLDLFMTV